MPENRVQTALQKLLPNAVPQRIETWTGTGIFDSNWQLECDDEIWVEYKQGKVKKAHPNCSYRIQLRATQLSWAAKRISNGANNIYVAYLLGKELLLISLNINTIAILRKPIDYSNIKVMNEFARIKLVHEI